MRNEIPDFRDDLDFTLEFIFSELRRASVDRKHPLHHIAVASKDSDQAQVRMVVLRKFDLQKNTLEFHTDVRSDKVNQFKENPKISILGYHPKKRYQIRVTGRVTIHHQNEISMHAWNLLASGSRKIYQGSLTPGTKLTHPLPPQSPGSIHSNDSKNFCLCEVSIDEIEWLYLSPSEHRRAHYTLTDGAFLRQWMVP